MVEKIEDLNFPAAVVTRLIKDALPPQASVTKEARQAIARAASVFVIYISTSSTTLARKDNHKTITAKYILDALELLEFESFVPPLKEELENYRKTVKEKKDSKVKREGGETTAMEIEEEATTSTEGNAAAASTSNAKPTEDNAAIASTSNKVEKVEAD